MKSSRYNPLTYSRKLENAGINDKAADVIAQELSNLINEDLATKSDLKVLETKLVIKLGGIMITGITILGFILKH